MIELRFDSIRRFEAGTQDKILKYRQLFIDLDNELIKLGNDPVGHRNLMRARTFLEDALFSTIKVIELQGECKIKKV